MMTVRRMVIRIILGSYLQFGGTVSRVVGGRCAGEPQLVYSFPFLGLNCTTRHCTRIVSLYTGCFCTWWVLNNNGIVQGKDYWDSTAVSLQCDIHHTS